MSRRDMRVMHGVTAGTIGLLTASPGALVGIVVFIMVAGIVHGIRTPNPLDERQIEAREQGCRRHRLAIEHERFEGRIVDVSCVEKDTREKVDIDFNKFCGRDGYVLANFTYDVTRRSGRDLHYRLGCYSKAAWDSGKRTHTYIGGSLKAEREVEGPVRLGFDVDPQARNGDKFTARLLQLDTYLPDHEQAISKPHLYKPSN